MLMSPEQTQLMKNQIEQQLNILGQPDNVKKHTVMTQMALAAPAVNVNPTARTDVERFTLYLQVLDYEMKVKQLQAAQGVNQYSVVQPQQVNPYLQNTQQYNAAPSYTSSVPNNVYAGNVGGINVDAGVNRFDINNPGLNSNVNTSVHVPETNNDVRFGNHEPVVVQQPVAAQVEQVAQTMVKKKLVPVDGVYHDILCTNSMTVEKSPIPNTNYFKWHVEFNDPESYHGNEYSHLLLTDLKSENKYLGSNYKEIMIDTLRTNPECNVVVAKVHLHNKIPINSKLPTRDYGHSINGNDYTSLDKKVNLWRDHLKSEPLLRRYLDRKFANYISMSMAIYFTSTKPILHSYLNEMEGLSQQVIELDAKANLAATDHKSITHKLTNTMLLAGLMLINDVAILDCCILKEELTKQMEEDERSVAAETEGNFYMDNENFVAIYTNHEDFKDLQLNNDLYSLVKDKHLFRNPIRLTNEHHKGLIDVLNLHTNYVRYKLFTPENEYVIVKDTIRKSYYLFGV